jgi:hypothetical protein
VPGHNLLRAADQLTGGRVSRSIDRRIRSEVERHLVEHREVVAAETKRQLGWALQRRDQQAQQDLAKQNRDFTSDVYFGAGRRFDRTLTARRYRRLTSEVLALTADPGVDWMMQQAFRTLVDHETRGLGRIAGSSYNIIGKLTVPALLHPPAGPVLEIGTLFGLFAPALVRQLRRSGASPKLTVVDPLVGTQIQPGSANAADPTGTPVSAEVARRNLLECGLLPEEFRIIQGYSTDEQVRHEVADERYAVVVIDGDHSEEGVYRDLWWVQDIVLPGAVIVMDDYGDRMWPGVAKATSRYLADGGALELQGVAATSAYLRGPAAS